MTHPNPKRNIVLRAVLMRKGLVPLTTARPVNTVQPRPTVNSARPMSNPFNKAHSSVRRPFNNLTAKKNINFYHRVNTVKGSGVNTARPKEAVNAARPKAAVNAARQKPVVNTARPKVVHNSVKGNRGVEQIVDFLNANPIKYALTVNPTIFESCVEQFWSTRVVKKVNGDVQIHALIDGKRIVVSKATIRRDLQFADEGGVDCLPTATIFEEIARMWYEKPSQKLTFYKAFFSPKWKFMIHTILQCLSAKTTTWNEFSSTVALAIICLATNHKFNFSKFILEGMLRNLDTKAVKFLMYPRFIQLFVNHQVKGLPSHKRKYIVPYHTKKFFGNMKRVGKDFSRNITPLFPTMVVQTQPQPPTITPTPTTPTPTTSTPTTST
ncbi:hypothetical protein Tco_1438688 [Tanacetum coccineum]